MVTRIEVKLYNEPNDAWTAEQQVLYRSGIPIENQERWLKASIDELYDWHLLDAAKLIRIAEDVHYAIECDRKIWIIVDSD